MFVWLAAPHWPKSPTLIVPKSLPLIGGAWRWFATLSLASNISLFHNSCVETWRTPAVQQRWQKQKKIPMNGNSSRKKMYTIHIQFDDSNEGQQDLKLYCTTWFHTSTRYPFCWPLESMLTHGPEARVYTRIGHDSSQGNWEIGTCSKHYLWRQIVRYKREEFQIISKVLNLTVQKVNTALLSKHYLVQADCL